MYIFYSHKIFFADSNNVIKFSDSINIEFCAMEIIFKKFCCRLKYFAIYLNPLNIKLAELSKSVTKSLSGLGRAGPASFRFWLFAKNMTSKMCMHTSVFDRCSIHRIRAKVNFSFFEIFKFDFLLFQIQIFSRNYKSKT